MVHMASAAWILQSSAACNCGKRWHHKVHAPNTEHAPRVAAARGNTYLRSPLQFEALTRWGVAEPLAGRDAHGLSCVDPTWILQSSAACNCGKRWEHSARTQHRACSFTTIALMHFLCRF